MGVYIIFLGFAKNNFDFLDMNMGVMRNWVQ